MKLDEIWIGNDHGGYEMKLSIAAYLRERQIPCRDIGCDSTEIVRYPYYAVTVAQAVSEAKISRGILICSTGIGMSIVANRFPNVRASLCTSTYMARMTRAHNDSNILCIGGKCLGVFEVYDMLDAWLNTSFEGDRHILSLDMLRELDLKL